MANVSRKWEEYCRPTHLQWELAVLELEVGLYNVDPTTILNWLSIDQCLFAHQEVDVLEAHGIVHRDGACWQHHWCCECHWASHVIGATDVQASGVLVFGSLG